MNFTLSKTIQSDCILKPVLEHHIELDRFAEKYAGHQALLLGFKGKEGEYRMIPVSDSGRENKGVEILLGLGSSIMPHHTAELIRKFAWQCREMLPESIQVDLSFFENGGNKPFEAADQVIQGLITSSYSPSVVSGEDHHGSDDKAGLKDVFLPEGELMQPTRDKAVVVGNARVAAMQLVDTPANLLTPEAMANWFLKSASGQTSVTVEVYDHKQISDLGLAALESVAAGSAVPPVFIVGTYKHGVKAPTVGLVGKGVTFDSGGLSIKQADSMAYMKGDMGGAAAVLNSFLVASRLGLPVNLIAVVPATENSVDARSTRPGDVIQSYLGKTIEVTNTDAEGRLILADALAWLRKNHNPDVIIDVATLTGSCVRTLGNQAAGLFTSNLKLSDALMQAAEVSGERLWPFPMWEQYHESMNSDVADIRNFDGSPVAGAITAAKFLEFFVDHHPAWAHLDIAGTSFGDSKFTKAKSATGYGVALLTSFLEKVDVSSLRN